MPRLLRPSLMMAAILTPAAGWAQPGGSLFEQHCAPCHGNPEPGSRAPDREALRQFTPERVLESLTTGAMSVEVPGLTDDERREVAQWAAGRALGTTGGDASSMPNQCPGKPFGDPFAGAGWNGWSPDVGNSRFQPAAAAGLTPDQVPRLTLKWAFGYPGGVRAAAGSPTVVGGKALRGIRHGLCLLAGCGERLCLLVLRVAMGRPLLRHHRTRHGRGDGALRRVLRGRQGERVRRQCRNR
jgi:polyvinyl alcohol dehydrogenase (cytochrome)